MARFVSPPNQILEFQVGEIAARKLPLAYPLHHRFFVLQVDFARVVGHVQALGNLQVHTSYWHACKPCVLTCQPDGEFPFRQDSAIIEQAKSLRGSKDAKAPREGTQRLH